MSAKTQHLKVIRERFLLVSQELLKKGATIEDLRLLSRRDTRNSREFIFQFLCRKEVILLIFIPLLYSLILNQIWISFVINYIQGIRCLVPNNYLVWEFTRPVSNCDFCRGINSALVLDNITKQDFENYAYSSKPIIVKKAASHWLASRVFSLQFFRSIYEQINGAYDSVDEECQFLHFRSNFANLREVFSMSEQRAMNLPGEESWYIGWKNCHPQVVDIMKKFYEPPHFLPDDAEIPNTNYIFLGYEQGAVMHLDYIPRLMWQGQIIGSKTWTVAPTPECDDICKSFSFFVDTGDVILLDTRIWYHGTQVEKGHFSLVITSEYG
ncbi:hypothetical protein QAD02_023690 [Eretmocerus hayati]|uniref:Uncharacterized protein n=1 Tax=Eretmocerus hayati TaxID=131215 RepID=A0ACC2PWC6_9HYME|nr:hypothetical protein QAD02_023690 [Eretmocerus hayati]